MVKSCRVKSIHLVHWNCTTSKCGKKTHLAGAGPSSANPPPSRHQTASYRNRSDPSGWNDRKPAIFQGKKCEDLTHKDGRLEILQKWKFVSPKIWFAICVKRLLNIKLCEMVHPQLHEDITGPTIVGEKVGDVTGYQPSKIRWKLTRFWATRDSKIWTPIGKIISSVW